MNWQKLAATRVMVFLFVVGSVPSTELLGQFTLQRWTFDTNPDDPDNVVAEEVDNDFGAPKGHIVGGSTEEIWVGEVDDLEGILVLRLNGVDFIVPNRGPVFRPLINFVKTMDITLVYQFQAAAEDIEPPDQVLSDDPPKVIGTLRGEEFDFKRLPGLLDTKTNPANWRLFTARFRSPKTVDDCPSTEQIKIPPPGADTFLFIDKIRVATFCDPDCNSNGVPDAEDISKRDSEDENSNGIPDECEHLCIVCALEGTPRFGKVTITIEGIEQECEIMISTSVNDRTARTVMDNLIDAIDNDDCTNAQEISAFSDENGIEICGLGITLGDVKFDVDDSGLSVVLKPIPSLSLLGLLILTLLILVAGIIKLKP